MRFGQCLPDLGRDIDGVINRQRPSLNPLLERLPLVARHHEVEWPSSVSLISWIVQILG